MPIRKERQHAYPKDWKARSMICAVLSQETAVNGVGLATNPTLKPAKVILTGLMFMTNVLRLPIC